MSEEEIIKQCIYESCTNLKEINKLISYLENLQQENTQLKSVLKKIREYIDSTLDGQYALEPDYAPDFTLVNTLEKIDDMLGKGLNRYEQR